jgi:hypothetical protein
VSKIEERNHVPSLGDAQKPKSRCKVRCRFGSQKGRGALSSRSVPSRAVSSSSWNGQPSFRRWDVSSHHLPPDELHDLEAAQAGASLLPDRVTLRPVSPTRLTPFDHYKSHTTPTQRVNPYEYSIRKLGITEEKFKECINEDISFILKEFSELQLSPQPSARHKGINTGRNKPRCSKPSQKNSRKCQRRKQAVAPNSKKGGSFTDVEVSLEDRYEGHKLSHTLVDEQKAIVGDVNQQCKPKS